MPSPLLAGKKTQGRLVSWEEENIGMCEWTYAHFQFVLSENLFSPPPLCSYEGEQGVCDSNIHDLGWALARLLIFIYHGSHKILRFFILSSLGVNGSQIRQPTCGTTMTRRTPFWTAPRGKLLGSIKVIHQPNFHPIPILFVPDKDIHNSGTASSNATPHSSFFMAGIWVSTQKSHSKLSR